MPINKKEKIIYTFLMVVFMVMSMSSYNVFLHNGFSFDGIKNVWLMFPLTFLVAFLIEWFIVAPLAIKLSCRLIREKDSEAKKGLLYVLYQEWS